MIKMPIACFLLVSYSFYYYKKRKRVRTYATWIFEIIICCVLTNLIADAVTEFTVNHRDMVSETCIYVWHIIFLETMLSICFLLYYYLVTYVERGTGISKQIERSCSLIVWIAVAIIVLLAPITYVDTQYGSYSLGEKAYALYVGAIYVIVLMVYNLVRYWRRIEKSKREVMLISILIFNAFSLLQMAFPYILATGLGMSMIVMGLLLTIEDSNQYLDKTRQCFNEQGCREMVREQISWARPFNIPVYVFIGSLEHVDQLIHEASAYMSAKYNCVAAVVGGNMIVFFPHERLWLKREKNFEELPQFVEENSATKEFSEIFSGDRYNTEEEIMEKLYRFKAKKEEDVLYKDFMTEVYNRNAYERDIAFVQKERRSLWYFLADINELKKINDTYGHASGDELICAIAVLLRQIFSVNARVYRIGGDEFAVLYAGEAAAKMAENLEEARRRLNEKREIPLRFAVGYAYYDAKREIWGKIIRRADYNMYADKMRNKEKEGIPADSFARR